MIREAREETGIDVATGDLRFLHVMHRAGEDGPDRIGFFFAADAWTGEPYNAEPGKCSELVWADPHDLLSRHDPVPGRRDSPGRARSCLLDLRVRPGHRGVKGAGAAAPFLVSAPRSGNPPAWWSCSAAVRPVTSTT
nr:hypothetical protein GCM10020092_004510 [Actinoplanes digitatis]